MSTKHIVRAYNPRTQDAWRTYLKTEDEALDLARETWEAYDNVVRVAVSDDGGETWDHICERCGGWRGGSYVEPEVCDQCIENATGWND